VTLVLIREVATGEEVRWDERHTVDDAIDYYRDGNGSCDCNRSLNWYYAHGATVEEAWALMDPEDTGMCRGVGKYAVKVLDEAGAVAYEDDGYPK
jgi:hypothetical protein